MTETTVAIVKWNALKANPKFDFTAYGFKVEYQIKAKVTDTAWWKAFYAEHEGKEYFDSLVAYMATDEALFAILSHPEGDAIQRWRQLIGPTKANMTKEPADCLRALYGEADAPRSNGFHGSDSKDSVDRETALIKQL